MRYLIAETNWDMILQGQRLADTGTLVTHIDRPEDIAGYARDGGGDLLLLDAEDLGHVPVSLGNLRAIAPRLPIALLYRKASSHQIADWLNAGADTAIPHQAEPREIVWRLNAVARRAHGLARPVLRMGGLRIDLPRRRVELDGISLHLSPKVYEMLEYIALRPGVIVTRDALLSHIYGLEDEPAPRVFDVYMCTLRNQLAACSGDFTIETVRGAGFRLIPGPDTDLPQVA